MLNIYKKNNIKSIAKKKNTSLPAYRNIKSVLLYAAVPLSLFCSISSASAASNPGAVQVNGESEDTVANIKDEAKTITERKMNKAALVTLQNYLMQTENNIAATQASLNANTTNLTKAKTDLAGIDQKLQVAKSKEETAKNTFWEAYTRALPAAQEADSLQGSIAHYQAVYEQAVNYEASVDSASGNTSSGGSAAPSSNLSPAEIEAKLQEYNYDENKLSQINSQLSGTDEEAADDSGDAGDYDNSALQAQAESQVDSAEARLDDAQNRMDELQDIISASDDAKADWDDAHNDTAELQKDEDEQKKYLSDLDNDQKDLQSDLNDYNKDKEDITSDINDTKKMLNPYQDYKTLQSTNEYYNWRDKNGNKGNQFISQLDYSQAKGKFEFGINTGIFKSNNKGNDNGSASGLLDTGLHLGVRNITEKDQVTYNLDVNVPTGKNNVHDTTAMSTDLVPYDTFGEGWQFKPSIQAKHMINDVDYVLYGGGVNFNGSYTYNDTNVNPGTELTGNIGWLHAAPTEQFSSQVVFTKPTKSQDGDLSYKEGNSVEWRNTYNKQLDQNYKWPSYVWLGYSGKTKYDNAAEIGGSQTRVFYGTGIEKKLSDEENLRLMFHGMHSIGDDYDPVTQLSFTGRNKYAVRLSYDKAFDDMDSYSISLEDFYMEDTGNSSNSYRGTDIMFNYTRSF